jgi:hypothetical protein
MRYFGSQTLIAWVACLLALGASGDDLNVMRLLMPGLSPHLVGPLPLDDPNTDFTIPDGVANLGGKAMQQQGDILWWQDPERDPGSTSQSLSIEDAGRLSMAAPIARLVLPLLC